MSKYTFDEIIDRSRNYAAKIEECEERFGKKDVIPMWIADMDFKAAKPIVDALTDRATQGIYGYTFRPNEYFCAVQEWQSRRHNWVPNVELMSYAPGILPMISTIMSAFLNKGDKVIVQEPVFQEFRPIVESWGGEVVVNQLVNTTHGYYMDLEDFADKARDGAKFFILCNPHNPLGRVWKKEELIKIGEICKKYNVTVISDEIYADMNLSGKKHIPFASISEEFEKMTITCSSVTKAFNLSGLQVGTAIFPNHDMKIIYDETLYKHQIVRNNVFSLIANTVALTRCEEWLSQSLEYIESNIDYACEYIKNNIPELRVRKPESTYLLWIDCSSLGMNGDELIKFFVEEAGIAPNDGRIFGLGGEGHVRLNLACPKSTVKKAMMNLENAIIKLRNR